MGIFDRFRRKSLASGGSSGGLALTALSQPPRRGSRELIAAYRDYPWLRAVTQRIARGVGCATWRVYAKAAPGGRAVKDVSLANLDRAGRARRWQALKDAGQLLEIAEHPLLDMLNHPNKRMTGHTALSLSQTYLDLKGEAFWLLERNAAGMPVGYWPLPPHWVTDVPNQSSRTYRINGPQMVTEVPESEMLWLRDADPLDPYGRGSGVAESLGDELEISEYASKHIKSFFYNKGLPAAIVSFEGASQPAMKEAKEQWLRENQGFWNSFKSYFTGSKIQVERLDTNFSDSEMNDLRKAQHDFVRECFAVPPEILGVIENSNRSTIDAAQFIFATGVLVPRLEFLRSELQHSLIPQFDDRIVLEYDTPVPEAREFQLQVVQAIPEAFQLNEIREVAGFEGLPELEGVFAHHASGAESNAPDAAGDSAAPETEPLAPPEGEKAGPLEPAWVVDLRARSLVTGRE